MKKLGQHFLKNPTVVKRTIEALHLEKGDRVIEVGPGHGELTVPLLEIAADNDCSIISIEKDRKLIAGLASIKARFERFDFVEGDALKLLPEIISRFVGEENKKNLYYKIVGNIPYYITGKLLRVISELEHKPSRVVLMIQKEVAERICAEPPQMNRLAASVQFWAEPKIIARAPKSDFSPPPEVDSAVIEFVTRDSFLNSSNFADNTLTSEHYYRAIRIIFAQPRKNLLNNVAAGAGKNVSKGKIEDSLKLLGIDPQSRPQNLSLEQIRVVAMGNLCG